MASTPAMVVVLTAPRPTSSTPSLPRAGAISTGEGTIENYIMRKYRMFLRKSRIEPLPVTMSGVRMGERVLQIGVDDPAVASAIAAKVGLSGNAAIAVADDRDAARAHACRRERGRSRRRHSDTARVAAVRQTTRSISSIAHDSARGLLSSLDVPDATRGDARMAPRASPGRSRHDHRSGASHGIKSIIRHTRGNEAYGAAGGIVGALETAGFKPVRLLAEREGYKFTEGIKT